MGQVISRDEFLKKFEDIKLTTKRNIDVHIFSLRKKISQTDVIIRSVRARGYCLEKL